MLKQIRKYYRPGIISLILIPVVYIPWSESYMDFLTPFKNYTVIGFATLPSRPGLSSNELEILPEKISDLNFGVFYNSSVLHYYTERDLIFTTIDSYKINIAKLDKVIKELSIKNKEEFSEESFENFGIKYALKVKLDNQSTYSDLIKLLDYCNEKGIDKKLFNSEYDEFIFLDDYSSIARRDTADNYFGNDVMAITCGNSNYPEETLMKATIKKIKERLSHMHFPIAIILISGYLIVLIMAIFNPKNPT